MRIKLKACTTISIFHLIVSHYQSYYEAMWGSHAVPTYRHTDKTYVRMVFTKWMLFCCALARHPIYISSHSDHDFRHNAAHLRLFIGARESRLIFKLHWMILHFVTYVDKLCTSIFVNFFSKAISISDLTAVTWLFTQLKTSDLIDLNCSDVTI